MIQKRDIDLPTRAYTTDPYTYAVAENIRDIAQMMQSLTHAGIAQMALVTIHLRFTATAKMYASEIPHADQYTRPYLDTLRPLVRKTDKVFLLVQHPHTDQRTRKHLASPSGTSHFRDMMPQMSSDFAPGATFYIVLLNANLQGGHIVQERLWDALHWYVHNDHSTDIYQLYSMTIGHSAYPIPSRNVQQCIAAARIARLRFEPSETASHQVLAQPVGAAELAAQARLLSIPYLEILPHQLPIRMKRLISADLAQELRCYPLGCERDKLTVAMLNPQDQQALERLHQETGMRIFPVLTSSRELQRVFETNVLK